MAFARTTGYIKAHAGLRALNRRTISLLDQPYDLIAAVLNYCGGFLGPIQDIDELAHLVADVRALNPRIIVEIGTHRGELFISGAVWRNRRLRLSASIFGAGHLGEDTRLFGFRFTNVFRAMVKSCTLSEQTPTLRPRFIWRNSCSMINPSIFFSLMETTPTTA
jgi:hypothetical protein